MKKKLTIDEMDYLESHLYDENISNNFILDRIARKYIIKAKRLPYEDMINYTDMYLDSERNNYYIFLNDIACKYNSNMLEILERLREVNSIRGYRSNKVLKLKK